MVEKTFRSGNMPKPVPMKLFSNWEVEKTSSNCIQRLIATQNHLRKNKYILFYKINLKIIKVFMT